MIYFAWVDAEDTFSSGIHSVEDEQVFDLSISQGEGEFATAEIEIVNPHVPLLTTGRKSYCFISRDGTLLFAGRLVGFPSHTDAEILKLEFIARPANWQSAQDTLVQSLKTLPYFDPIAFDDPGTVDPADVLEARSGMLHWNRATGACTLSDIVSGSLIDFGSKAFDDSIEFDISAPPLTSVSVSVSAEWEQVAIGYFDVHQLIQDHFPSRFISTLTGDDFESSWPSAGASVGSETGYTWSYSRLAQAYNPGFSGIYPPVARVLVQTSEDPSFDPMVDDDLESRYVEIERKYYNAELGVRAEYRQRRQESVSFTLVPSVQPMLEGETETIEIALGDVSEDRTTAQWRAGQAYGSGAFVIFGESMFRCLSAHTASGNFWSDYNSGRWTRQANTQAPLGSKMNASYFLQPRGAQSIQHAMLRAKARLLKSMRAVAVKFSVPLDWQSVGISCAHTARIVSDRIPGGEATGKIVAYTLRIDSSGQEYVDVEIECCVGRGESVPTAGAGEAAIDGIVYSTGYSSQKPQEPISARDVGVRSYMLLSLRVFNPVQNQIALVASAGKKEEIDARLRDNVTSFDLSLRPLAATDSLEHHINLAISDTVAGPRQIDLE